MAEEEDQWGEQNEWADLDSDEIKIEIVPLDKGVSSTVIPLS